MLINIIQIYNFFIKNTQLSANSNFTFPRLKQSILRNIERERERERESKKRQIVADYGEKRKPPKTF
jgi:hypothetical protein